MKSKSTSPIRKKVAAPALPCALDWKSFEAIMAAVTKLHEPCTAESYPGKALAAIRAVIPAKRCAWMAVDHSQRLVKEIAAPDVSLSRVDDARKAFGTLAEQHPCFADLFSFRGAEALMKLSDYVDPKAWGETEFAKLIHLPDGVSDEMIASATVGGDTFALVLGTDAEFKAQDVAVMRLLLPQVAQGWRASLSGEAASLSGGTRDKATRLVVPVRSDYRAAPWPPKVSSVLRRHSSAPVLTCRLPLPEDFLVWLDKAMKHLAGGQRETYALSTYTAKQGGSGLVAKLITGGSASEALLVIEVTPVKETAAHLAAVGLSPRECEVAYWVGEGKRNGEIGEILGCTKHTAAKHVQNILLKLGVETRAGITAAVMEGDRHKERSRAA